MKQISYIFNYLIHAITARNTGGFGIHSPFVFNFIQYVLKESHPFYAFEVIEKIRRSNLQDNRSIDVKDFGSGKSRSRKISEIASHALKPAKQAQLLFRTIQYFKFGRILELGTSLGITTLYMEAASTKKSCVTLEGCSEIATVARNNFSALGKNTIQLIECNISEQLVSVLNQYGRQDLIFIDANHRYDALKEYFEVCVEHTHDQSIIIIDDIYWSSGMKKAWSEIKQHPRVTTTIDIFHMGFVFFNPTLGSKHYKVRY